MNESVQQRAQAADAGGAADMYDAGAGSDSNA